MSEPNTSASGSAARSGKTAKAALVAVVAVGLVALSSAATLAITRTTLDSTRPAAVGEMTPVSAAGPVRGGRVPIPQELREDLLAVREAPEADRPAMIADIRAAGADGDYGPAVQRLLERIDDAIAEQSPELQAAIGQIRAATTPDERRELVRQLREDIDSGVYGDAAQARAEDLRTAFLEDGARGLIRQLRAR